MNIFIVSSTILTNAGVFKSDERFNQTIKTYDSIREKDKQAIIFAVDSSTSSLSDKQLNIIESCVDFFLNLNNDKIAQDINKLSNIHLVKSLGENYLINRALLKLKENINFSSQSGRCYKMGARCFFEPQFDLKRFDNNYGKYIFKSKVKSWRGNDTYLFDTRFYSWCFSLVDDYLSILTEKNPKLILSGLDTEHAHYINIPTDKVTELDKLHVGCYIALNGQYVSD